MTTRICNKVEAYKAVAKYYRAQYGVLLGRRSGVSVKEILSDGRILFTTATGEVKTLYAQVVYDINISESPFPVNNAEDSVSDA